jgi:hypothetical protein
MVMKIRVEVLNVRMPVMNFPGGIKLFKMVIMNVKLGS